MYLMIKEDFLYYLWKFGKLQLRQLTTTQKETIQIVATGTYNQLAGPDFFNAKIRIGNQLWAGNVEMHVNASDWFVHHHEKDKNYDNVILHVVWNHDIEIHRKDNSVIPTLELKAYVALPQIHAYTKLINAPKKWINCEADFPFINDFHWSNWLERLFIERLARKAAVIEKLVKQTHYDWEAVLFRLLAKSFGLKLNSEAFYEATTPIDFSWIRKLRYHQTVLEAFLFGSFGLLTADDCQEPYFYNLKREFSYQKNKFDFQPPTAIPIQFFGTRPPNFPTIRISQLAMLYHREQALFSKLIAVNSLDEIYEILQVPTSEFWETHYTFDKSSPKRTKIVSKNFIDVIIINTILPLKYVYDKKLGKSPTERIIELIQNMKPEKNTMIKKFSEKNIAVQNALQTQALIELKKNYCDMQKCLQCAIGCALLNKNELSTIKQTNT